MHRNRFGAGVAALCVEMPGDLPREIRAAREAGVPEFHFAQSDVVEVGHREVRLGEVAVFDPRVLQVALVEHGFPAVDPLDQGIRQIGLEKVRLAHVGRDLLLGSDIGILQVGFLEVGLGEVVPVG